ncbi:MAG: porin [Fimbriimonadaceae bacterium]
MKRTIVVFMALGAIAACAHAGLDQSVPTKKDAKETISQGEKTALGLNAEARDISKRIGELAISGDIAKDPKALDEMKRLVAALDEVNARLATLESSIAELKEWVAGKEKSDAVVAKAMGDTDKIKFGHYFQFQYRDTDAAGAQQHSFEARRFRFGASMEINKQAAMKVSFDAAAGTNRRGFEMKDMIFTYKPKGSEGLTLTAGQFSAPLGYETPWSSSSLEFPERVTYNATMFADERVRGVMAEQALEGGLSIYGGIVNALSTKDAEQSSLASGPGGRLAGYAGLKYKQGDFIGGVSYFAGERPEFTGGGGTSPAVDRRFLYLDAQLTNLLNSGLYVRAEAMIGSDRVPSTTGAPGNVANDMTGWHATLGYPITSGELFTRYSIFDPNTDVDGDGILEYGFGYRHHLGTGATLALTHEIFEMPTVANSPFGVTTLRLQFKF